jgi:predicted enzyme related to lactoylglutathione lyase
VVDFERARRFYEAIYEMKIEVMDFGGFKMGIFPHRDVGVAICFGAHYKPGTEGPVVYLDANPDLQEVLGRVEDAGGQVLQPKKMISPEYGYMALFLDSEGNRLALHSKG